MSDDDAVYGNRWMYLPTSETLVLADLHVGYAASSQVDRSLDERNDLATRLATARRETDPETVVVAGDLLHAFDGVPTGVSRTLEAIEAATAGADLIVTPGNHDTFLEVLVDEIPIPETYRVSEDTVVTHGHVEPQVSVDHYIVGHDHPALEIAGDRHPCFLVGIDQYEGATVTMLPTFSRFPRGTPVGDRRTGDLASPLLTDLGSCRPVVVADTVHKFPALRDLRPHL